MNIHNDSKDRHFVCIKDGKVVSYEPSMESTADTLINLGDHEKSLVKRISIE